VKLTVDIGGASGTLVHSLMAENPNLLGIVFDLPTAVPAPLESGFVNRDSQAPENERVFAH
jgi:hypothetical protein